MRSGSVQPVWASGWLRCTPWLLLGLCASAAADASLSCVVVRELGCRCSLTVRGGACPGGEAHLAHALVDGAPLQFRLAGMHVAARSRWAASNSFTHGAGDSWSEDYRFDGGSVSLHYRPAPSTCSKPHDDEPCEYFDVSARVEIRAGDAAPVEFEALGSCGC